MTLCHLSFRACNAVRSKFEDTFNLFLEHYVLLIMRVYIAGGR